MKTIHLHDCMGVEFRQATHKAGHVKGIAVIKTYQASAIIQKHTHHGGTETRRHGENPFMSSLSSR
jgi:hypothetical protein